MSKLFSKLFIEYSKLVKNQNNDLLNIGEQFAYYYADDNQIGLIVHNVIEIDIKSAFPTICNIWFDKNSEFLIKLNAIEDKLEKNIYMTNYLVSLGKRNDRNYLIDLNNYTKLTIFSKIFNEYDDVNIFEYKKDSLLFHGNKAANKSSEINKLLIDANFKFHENLYKVYIRFNRTSIYLKDSEVIIKGKYKDAPEFVKDIITKYLVNGDIDEENILRIYSNFTYELLKNTREFDYYYKFGNKSIEPSILLNDFLIPLIYIIKSNK
jgi:hypothetical protein